MSTGQVTPQAAIPIEAAKHWFDSTRQQSASSSVDESTLFLMDAAPNWQDALNDLNQSGQAFVVAPIRNDYYRLNGNAKLLVFRDSMQQLQGVFMIYLPDEAYRIQTNGNYNPATFTGIVVYTNVNGQAFLSYRIVNGQIERLYNATINRRRNAVFRDCLEMGFPSCQYVFDWCGNITFCDCSGNCGFIGGSVFGPTGNSSSGNSGGSFSYGNLGAGRGNGGANSGSSGGGGGGAWNSSQPASLFTLSEIEVLRIKFRNANLDDIFYTLELHQGLLKAANSFLDARGWDNLNKPALENLVNTTGEYAALAGYLTALSVYTDFYNATISTNALVSTFVAFAKYHKVGFTVEEIISLMSNATLLNAVAPALGNLSSLNTDQVNEIKAFINSNASSLPNISLFQVQQQTRDVRLDFQTLSNNNDYEGLGTDQLRQLVRQYNSNVPDFKVNISAGNILEQAYGEFSGYRKSANYLSQVTNGGTLGLKVVRPDFMHPTTYTENPATPREKQIVFYAGGVVEVKCPQNAVTLEANDHQIEGEINIARFARGDDGIFAETVASTVKAGAFTLVIPYGANIDPAVIAYATSVNVNFYVVYAFFNRNDYKVVFSNPIKKNFLSIEKSYVRGSLEGRVQVDIGKAIRRFAESNDNTDE